MATLGEGKGVGVDETYIGTANGTGLSNGSEPVPAAAAGGVIIIDEGVMT